MSGPTYEQVKGLTYEQVRLAKLRDMIVDVLVEVRKANNEGVNLWVVAGALAQAKVMLDQQIGSNDQGE